MIFTAMDLNVGKECYAQRKAAADGKETNPFASVDELFAKEYSERFEGYEQKFNFVKEQVIKLRDELAKLGYETEDELEGESEESEDQE